MLNNNFNSEVKDENINSSTSEKTESFSEIFENSINPKSVGDIVNVKVVSKNEDELMVDFGYKSDGIIPIEELSENDKDSIEIEDHFEAIIIKDNGEGNVVLSKKRVDYVKSVSKLKKAFESNTVILVKVLRPVNGGVIAAFESMEIFVPISQLHDKYVENVQDFVGNVIPVKVMKFEEENKNFVASSRIVLEEGKALDRTNFWESLYVGKEFSGIVSSIVSYGVFVNLNVADGLLHISEISYVRDDDAAKHFNIGDRVEVYIKEFNKETKKISLGLKNRPDNPLESLIKKYNIDDIVDCRVSKIMSYGAFLEIEPGLEGLVHISEISEKRLSKPNEVLSEGEFVKAKILSINIQERKISLSIKAVAPINSKTESNIDMEYEEKSYTDENFGMTIGDFIKKK